MLKCSYRLTIGHNHEALLQLTFMPIRTMCITVSASYHAVSFEDQVCKHARVSVSPVVSANMLESLSGQFSVQTCKSLSHQLCVQYTQIKSFWHNLTIQLKHLCLWFAQNEDTIHTQTIIHWYNHSYQLQRLEWDTVRFHFKNSIQLYFFNRNLIKLRIS